MATCMVEAEGGPPNVTQGANSAMLTHGTPGSGLWEPVSQTRPRQGGHTPLDMAPSAAQPTLSQVPVHSGRQKIIIFSLQE